MATATVGILKVLLTANTAEFNTAMKSAAESARTWSRDLKQVGLQAQQVGMALTKTLTLPIVAGLGSSIKAFADFDAAMTKSTAIMGNLSTEMRTKLEVAAREVAKTTTFSAKEAADAYFFLASAGLDAAQSIEALPRVAKFAQAGNFDLARATDLLTDAQSALGLTIRDDVVKNMENMARVSDVLVKANTLANATVQQFSEALTNRAGAALRLVNKDVEEGVAVLAAFADQGVKGAEAGTRLDIVLRDLQVRGVKAKDELSALGVTVFDANGKMRNMADIIGELERALQPMSDETRRATLMQIGFQDRSVSAMLSLIGFSDAIRGYEKNLRSAAGVTDEVANKQLQTFQAQLKLLWSRITDVGIELGKALIPAMTLLMNVVEKALPLVEGLVKAFTALPAPVQLVGIGLLGVVAAAGPLLYIFGQLAISASALIGAFTTKGIATKLLTGSMAGLTGQTAALAATTATAGTTVATTATKVGLLSRAFSLLMNPIGLAAGALAGAGLAVAKVTGQMDTLKMVVSGLPGVFADLGRIIKSGFIIILEELSTAVRDTWAVLKGFGGWLSDQLPDALKNAEGGISLRVIPVLGQMEQAIRDAGKEWPKFADFIRQAADRSEESARRIQEAGRAVAGAGASVAATVAQFKELNAFKSDDLLDRFVFKKTEFTLQPLITEFKQFGPAFNQGVVHPVVEGTKTFRDQLEAARQEIAKLGKESPDKLQDLTLAIQSNAFSAKELQEKYGLSERALKLFTDSLKSGTKATKDATTEAEKHAKMIEKQGEALSKLGIVTQATVNKALTELADLENLATTAGANHNLVLARMVPLLKELHDKAVLSGVGIDQTTAALERARKATAALMAELMEALPRIPAVVDGLKELPGTVIELTTIGEINARRLTEAYHQFGLKTRAELEKTARESIAAFNLIAQSGTATPVEIKAAFEKMTADVKAVSGEIPSFWQTQVVPGVVRTLETLQTAVSGSFAQMLLGAKKFGDGFVDIWKAIKASVLNIFNTIVDAFIKDVLGKIIGALRGQQGGITGGFGNLLSGLFGLGGRGAVAGALPGTQLPIPTAPGAAAGAGGGGSLLSMLGGGGIGFGAGFGISSLTGSRTAGVLGGIGSGLTSGFMMGGPLGGLIGASAGLLGGLLGGQSRGRDMVKDFAEQMGGFDALRQRLNALPTDVGERLWRDLTQGVGRNNPTQAKAAIDAIQKALGDMAEKEARFNQGLTGHLQRIIELGGALPDSIKGYLDSLAKAGRLTEDNIGLLAQLSGDGQVDWRKLEEAANRYGVSTDKLGQSFQAAKLNEAWQQLIDDIDLFERGAIDVNGLLVDMADEISELVQQSQKFGTDIPENMRPWIEKLIESGLLLDENGNRIEDISKLSFGGTLLTSLEKLIKAVQDLIDTLRGVPSAIDNIPSDVNVRVRYHVDEPPPVFQPEVGPLARVATGGMVTPTGVVQARAMQIGGTARALVGNLVQFKPQGTDTVPAMLTPGEVVLNEGQQQNIGQTIHAGLAAMQLGMQAMDARMQMDAHAMTATAGSLTAETQSTVYYYVTNNIDGIDGPSIQRVVNSREYAEANEHALLRNTHGLGSVVRKVIRVVG